MAKKINLDIQLFNTSQDQWFDEAQQEALLRDTKAGLDSLTTGTDELAKAISTLAENWHSPDAEKYGNPLVTSLKTFIKDSREYVSSITNWMATHGTKINTINGASVSFSGKEANTSITINDFKDDASRRGLTDVNTATTTKTSLTNAVSSIEAALQTVMRAATSNQNALPQGVIPNSLVPTVSSENEKIKGSFDGVKTAVSNFTASLSEAISSASSAASSSTNN